MCDINEDFIARVVVKCRANVHFKNEDALFASIKNGNLEMMKLLLDNGADMNASNNYLLLPLDNGARVIYHKYPLSALSHAAYRGITNMVKILLEHHANIKIENKYALSLGAYMGHIEIVAMLLEGRSDVHANDDAALQHSVKNGHFEIVVALLNAGANVNACNDAPLRLSITNYHLIIVAKLLECGADVHCLDDKILKNLEKCFDEALADILLPYCGNEDYQYFPEEYIKRKIISTKSAANA